MQPTKKKKQSVYSMQGGILLKGNIIKNGLDTSRLVNLITVFSSPDYFKMAGYPFPPHLFFVSDISFNETVGILINKFNKTKEWAIAQTRLWYQSFNLQRINEDLIERFIPLIKETNESVVKELGGNYRIGEEDTKIIACFLKEGVTIVHSSDKGFKETCRKLHMGVAQIPVKDLQQEKDSKKKLL